MALIKLVGKTFTVCRKSLKTVKLFCITFLFMVCWHVDNLTQCVYVHVFVCVLCLSVYTPVCVCERAHAHVYVHVDALQIVTLYSIVQFSHDL